MFQNEEELEALEVGMCLVSFFSRSEGEGWSHHYSEIFDSYHWICGKSVDGFRCIDLQGIVPVEAAERRKFDQTLCSQCHERLSSPQLVSVLSFGQTRLELGFDSNQASIDPKLKTEDRSTLDFDSVNNLTPTKVDGTDKNPGDLTRIVDNDFLTSSDNEKEVFTSTPKCDETADKELVQKLVNLISNGKDSDECLPQKPDEFGEKENSVNENDAAVASTSSSSSSTLANESSSSIISSSNNNKVTTDDNPESNSNQEVSGSSSYETLTTTETEDSDNKASVAKTSNNDYANVAEMVNSPRGSTNSGGSKRIRVVPEAWSSDSDASILSFRGKSFQNENENCSTYRLPPRFRDKPTRPKRLGHHYSHNSSSSGSLINGPEILYRVPAKIVSIDPNIKISFLHLSASSNVCVEVVDEKVKVENKFGSFVLAQQVALTWLRRHLHVDQVVDINAVVDKDVWKILLIRGEFKAQTKLSKPTEKSVEPGTN